MISGAHSLAAGHSLMESFGYRPGNAARLHGNFRLPPFGAVKLGASMERRPSCWPAADYGRRPCGFVSLRWATVVVCSIILLCLAQGKEAFGAVERMLPSFLVFDDDELMMMLWATKAGNGALEMAIANWRRDCQFTMPCFVLQLQCIRIL